MGNEQPDPSQSRMRRGGPLILGAVGLVALVSMCSSNSGPAGGDIDALLAGPLHGEARSEVLAANEIVARWGEPDDYAEIREIEPAGNFDEFKAACGYRETPSGRERVIVVGRGMLYERAQGAEQVFKHVADRVGC